MGMTTAMEYIIHRYGESGSERTVVSVTEGIYYENKTDMDLQRMGVFLIEFRDVDGNEYEVRRVFS